MTGSARCRTPPAKPEAGRLWTGLRERAEADGAPGHARSSSDGGETRRGGGWAEGYYVHYWLYEWLIFCEVARRCGGMDLYEMAPQFYRERAVASAFEMYPGIREYGSRRPIPMGGGGGIVFGGDRDKALSARRMLVNRYRDAPAHQYVHAFNERDAPTVGRRRLDCG